MVQETCVNTRATDQMNRDDSVSKVLHFPDLQDTELLQVHLYECIYPRPTIIKDFVTQTVRLPKQNFSYDRFDVGSNVSLDTNPICSELWIV